MDEQRIERVRDVRRRLAEHGPPRTRPYDNDFARVAVPLEDCDALRDLLVADRVTTVVEVGLAYASSALAIGEALVTVQGSTSQTPKHVIIDPFQVTDYGNVGWELLENAGLADVATLVTEPSSSALPKLVADEFSADAAFVDGSHRFHEVFVDLYFLRTIVKPGGLVILDDYWWPSVRTAVSYYETNLGWASVTDAFESVSLDRANGTPRTRAFRLPDPAFEPRFDEFQAFWTSVSLHRPVMPHETGPA
ncbi:MAG TPA: class I SAM-dependent methyltransferase [Actinopolymorphaceae bacterium]